MSTNKKTIIGVLGTPNKNENNRNYNYVYEEYTKVILSEGCIPFIILPIQDIDFLNTQLSEMPELTEKEKETYKNIIDMCDGLLIPGGNRIYPFYRYVVEYAIEQNKPILGICLGMQTLASIDIIKNSQEEDPYFIKKIEPEELQKKHQQRELDYAHTVTLEPNTKLSKIIPEKTIKVNSMHNYCINGPYEFIIAAKDENGIIEAIELPGKRFVIGIQWHPEKMYKYDHNAKILIQSFTNECKKDIIR